MKFMITGISKLYDLQASGSNSNWGCVWFEHCGAYFCTSKESAVKSNEQ